MNACFPRPFRLLLANTARRTKSLFLVLFSVFMFSVGASHLCACDSQTSSALSVWVDNAQDSDASTGACQDDCDGEEHFATYGVEDPMDVGMVKTQDWTWKAQAPPEVLFLPEHPPILVR